MYKLKHKCCAAHLAVIILCSIGFLFGRKPTALSCFSCRHGHADMADCRHGHTDMTDCRRGHTDMADLSSRPYRHGRLYSHGRRLVCYVFRANSSAFFFTGSRHRRPSDQPSYFDYMDIFGPDWSSAGLHMPRQSYICAAAVQFYCDIYFVDIICLTDDILTEHHAA